MASIKGPPLEPGRPPAIDSRHSYDHSRQLVPGDKSLTLALLGVVCVLQECGMDGLMSEGINAEGGGNERPPGSVAISFRVELQENSF